MKVVVTGATGFVGAALVRGLAAAGHTVLATGRQRTPPPGLLKYAGYLPGDVTQQLPLFRADACIHTAALASDSATIGRLHAVNVEGTRQVLRAARNCSHFVQISSSSVYRFGRQAVPESAAIPSRLLSPYGLSKLLAEEVVMNERGGAGHTLILRPRAIYGLGDRILLPRLLRLLRGRTILCPVNETTRTSLTQVDNLVHAVRLFLDQQPCPPIQVFNVADEPDYSLREIIIELLTGLVGKHLTIKQVPDSWLRLLVHVSDYLPVKKPLTRFAYESLTQTALLDTSAIRKGLAYTAPYTFAGTLPMLAEWVQRQGGVQAYLAQQQQAPWL
jgi:2-alkyl-3-oxoalkanoate reductase